MALFIEPIIEKMLAILAARTPVLLSEDGWPEFAEYGKVFTGGGANLPAVWAMAARTQFAEEESTLHQAHQITVKFGVQAAEPKELMRAVFAYMRAVHRAIEKSWSGDWEDAIEGGQVQRLFIREHNYGSTWARDGSVAKYPELDVVIEVQEAREET
jgi:hypothetical protein